MKRFTQPHLIFDKDQNIGLFALAGVALWIE